MSSATPRTFSTRCWGRAAPKSNVPLRLSTPTSKPLSLRSRPATRPAMRWPPPPASRVQPRLSRSPGWSCSATSPAPIWAPTCALCRRLRTIRLSRLRYMAAERVPAVLSIAGSDSGGGAGIQADLKAFARVGVHGMTAITAITAQNTVCVDAVEPVSGEMLLAQIAAVAEDIGVDAVKVGMVGSAEAIEGVVAALALILKNDPPVVVDPVMVSESGSPLLDPDAHETLAVRLLPMASVVTPNIPEAR